jgi:hypothetical protein
MGKEAILTWGLSSLKPHVHSPPLFRGGIQAFSRKSQTLRGEVVFQAGVNKLRESHIAKQPFRFTTLLVEFE